MTPTWEESLAWGESPMQPVTPDQSVASVGSLLELLEGLPRNIRQELAAGSVCPKKAGYPRMGICSGLARKDLMRVEGPTPSPADDVLLEAKELGRLEAVPCVQAPITGEVFRVITAAEQIGRIRHDILLVVPHREDQGPGVRDWWVRSWDPTYKEVEVADLEPVAELAHDAGAQLGAANLRDSIPLLETQMRHTELSAVRRLAPRIRATVRGLTNALLACWGEALDSRES